MEKIIRSSLLFSEARTVYRIPSPISFPEDIEYLLRSPDAFSGNLKFNSQHCLTFDL